jgi:hypothetical protein
VFPAVTVLDAGVIVTVAILSVNRSSAVSPEVCPVAVITNVTPPSVSVIDKSLESVNEPVESAVSLNSVFSLLDC